MLPEIDRRVGEHARVRLWRREGAQWRPRAGAHSGAEIAWIAEGEVSWRIGSQTLVAREGCAVLVPAQVEHATVFEGPMRGGALWIDRSMLGEIADARGPSVRMDGLAPMVLPRSPAIARLGAVLADECATPEEGFGLAAEAIVEAMTACALRATSREDDDAKSSAPRRARDARIIAALDRVHSGYREALTVDELARIAAMSRFHFSRLFREEVGQAPYRYLTKVRMAHAAAMLRGGHHNVTETALSVGFRDFGRFSRTFREHFGRRPAEWARALATRSTAQA